MIKSKTCFKKFQGILFDGNFIRVLSDATEEKCLKLPGKRERTNAADLRQRRRSGSSILLELWAASLNHESVKSIQLRAGRALCGISLNSDSADLLKHSLA